MIRQSCTPVYAHRSSVRNVQFPKTRTREASTLLAGSHATNRVIETQLLLARAILRDRQVNRLDAWLRDRSQSVKPRCNRDDATRGRVRGCVPCRNRATRLSRFFSRPRVFVLLSSWVAVSSRTYRRHIRFVVRGFRLCPAFVHRISD